MIGNPITCSTARMTSDFFLWSCIALDLDSIGMEPRVFEINATIIYIYNKPDISEEFLYTPN